MHVPCDCGGCSALEIYGASIFAFLASCGFAVLLIYFKDHYYLPHRCATVVCERYYCLAVREGVCVRHGMHWQTGLPPVCR